MVSGVMPPPQTTTTSLQIFFLIVVVIIVIIIIITIAILSTNFNPILLLGLIIKPPPIISPLHPASPPSPERLTWQILERPAIDPLEPPTPLIYPFPTTIILHPDPNSMTPITQIIPFIHPNGYPSQAQRLNVFWPTRHCTISTTDRSLTLELLRYPNWTPVGMTSSESELNSTNRSQPLASCIIPSPSALDLVLGSAPQAACRSMVSSVHLIQDLSNHHHFHSILWPLTRPSIAPHLALSRRYPSDLIVAHLTRTCIMIPGIPPLPSIGPSLARKPLRRFDRAVDRLRIPTFTTTLGIHPLSRPFDLLRGNLSSVRTIA